MRFMAMTKYGVLKMKGVIQFIVTFLAILSFIFFAVLTGLHLASCRAYSKFLKGPIDKQKNRKNLSEGH